MNTISMNFISLVGETVRVLHPDGGVVEVRILNTQSGTVAGYFDVPETLAQAVMPWNGKTSIYFTVNPVRPDLMARGNNRLVKRARLTTKDEDVIERRWFLLDLDPKSPPGVSATEAELTAALARRDEIVAWLRDAGWPEPILAMSGNGGHGLWPVHLPNTPEITELFKAALKALGRRFSDASVKVDESVFNAARIWKLYGTVACKGDPVPERPHRQSFIEKIPEPLVLVGLDQLGRIASLASEPVRPMYSIPRTEAVLDLAEIFREHGWYLRELSGTKHAVRCPWANEHSMDSGITETVIFDLRGAGGAWGFKCMHAHCAVRTIKDVYALLQGQDGRAEGQDSFFPHKSQIGKETNFRPVKAADLLAYEPEPVIWIWEPFIPEGALALLVGYTKNGKTTFAYALAVAVAQGHPFLDFPTKQGGVLILAVEEHPRDVERRLRRFGMQPEDPLHVHAGRLDNSLNTLREIREFIITNGIGLVILDTLARYWNITDENDNSMVVRLVSPLLDLARETGVAMLLVHHERKTGGEDGRAIRGGSALLGLVDQALLLDRRQGGESTQRVLRTLGRYDETPRELILALVGDEYLKLGSPEELDLEAARRKVWEALSEEPRDVKTLAHESGLKDKQVRKALEALGDRVIRESEGKKNNPYTYRRATPNSIRSQSTSIWEETNSSPERVGIKVPEVDDHTEATEEEWP